MTRQSRNSANSLLRTAEEALSGPRRREAGSVPGWALPRSRTLGRFLPRRPGTSAQSACTGFGVRAASTSSDVAWGHSPRATHQYSPPALCTAGTGMPLLIAICTAHVLNSPRAPIASLTGKLTRHERRPNRGRYCAKALCGPYCGRQRAAAGVNSGCTPIFRKVGWQRASVAGRSRSPHRNELRGSASSCLTPLS